MDKINNLINFMFLVVALALTTLTIKLSLTDSIYNLIILPIELLIIIILINMFWGKNEV